MASRTVPGMSVTPADLPSRCSCPQDRLGCDVHGEFSAVGRAHGPGAVLALYLLALAVVVLGVLAAVVG